MTKARKAIVLFVLFVCSLSSLCAKTKFALVLSGGGARGIAHIPVIQELEKRGIVPDLVVGTSMGALVGGLYASGWTGDELENLVLNNDILGKMMILNNRSGKASFLSPDSLSEDNIVLMEFGSQGIGSSNGVLDDQSVNGFLRENLVKVLDIKDFDDLSIPFRAIGTDITNGGEIVFDSGSMYTALRSSMSLPIVFPPVKLENNVYVMDGGLVNNLPVNIAKDWGADIILAVDVNDALNTNKKVSSQELETLSGSISAFTRSLNMSNSVPQYELADWVLVPNVNDFDTIAFNKTEDILTAGRECVYDNIEVFDKIEQLTKRSKNEFVKYSDRDDVVIYQIDKGKVVGFDKELRAFIGEKFDNETTAKFEELLLDIKYHNRFKDLSYEFDDGVISLLCTEYNTMDGVFSLGASGAMGVEYNGSDDPFFVVLPKLSVAVQYHAAQKAIISAALVYHDTLTLQSRFSVPMYKNSYYYAGIDLDYLNMSMITIPTKKGHLVRNDMGASIVTGFFWDPALRFVANVAGGFDYAHLVGLYDPTDEGRELIPYSNLGYAYFVTSLNYNSLDRKKAMKNGAKFDISLSVGADIDFDSSNDISFAYDFESNGSFVFGKHNDYFKGVLDFEIDTIRRNPYLSKAYKATYGGGIPTMDYIYSSLGVRCSIPGTQFFVDASPYVEFFQRYVASNDIYWTQDRNLVPFSTLNTWSLGAKLTLGMSTEVGTIYFDMFMGGSDTFKCSVLLGLR